MLRYKPSARKYPGDERMRPSTQQILRQRAVSRINGPGRPRKDSERVEVMTESSVTVGDLKKATRGNRDQICKDLSRLKKHLNSVETGIKHEKTCFVCGNIAYSCCKLCGNKAMHFSPQKGKCSKKDCFVDYHNDVFFGLALDDTNLLNERKSNLTPPNIMNRKNHE